jgi:hypothetical protein
MSAVPGALLVQGGQWAGCRLEGAAHLKQGNCRWGAFPGLCTQGRPLFLFCLQLLLLLTMLLLLLVMWHLVCCRFHHLVLQLLLHRLLLLLLPLYCLNLQCCPLPAAPARVVHAPPV